MSVLEAINKAIEDGESVDDIATEYSKTSENDRRIGKLIGKIVTAKGYDEIEAAFDWYKKEYNNNEEITYFQKMLVIFQCAQTLGCSQKEYNLIRKMFLTVSLGFR